MPEVLQRHCCFYIRWALLIPVGFVFAELCSAMPVAGGEMAFTYRGFGTKARFFRAGFCCWPILASVRGNLWRLGNLMVLYSRH
jgi:hypothetical protein